MSKIAEQKALEAYPPHYQKLAGDGYFDMSLEKREGYIRGYNQALQDIKEFFYDKFNIHPHDCHVGQYVSDTPLENMDDFIKQIENYIRDEQQ